MGSASIPGASFSGTNMTALATVRQINTPGQFLSLGNATGNGTGNELTDRWFGARRDYFLDQDLELIERCLAGEDAAWEDLVKVHTRRVYSICYRFTSSDTEAQDLTQEVFLRVFRSLKSF